MSAFVKYPSTVHLEGSKSPVGVIPAGLTSFRKLPSGLRVAEEKVDGDHCGIGFDPHDGVMFLQSHGGPADPSNPRFSLFAEWASSLETWLRDALGRRYVLFGDWMQFRHAVFYDRLDHLFLEYDVFDRERGFFLSTEARRRLLSGLPVVPVPLLDAANLGSPSDMRSAILGQDGKRRSVFKTENWRDCHVEAALAVGLDPDDVASRTANDDAGEGAYLKVEDGDAVVGRYKFILPGFIEAILGSGTHWNGRRRLSNRLADGVNIFDFPSAANAYSS